jgi:SH3 domain protein
MQTPMKIAVLSMLVLTLWFSAALAEKKYVSEDFEITLRTGPGTDRKIIALIQSGNEVDVVAPGDEWSEVVTSGGKQGWVLSRYLTDRVPTVLKLERLQQKFDKMQAEYTELQQKATGLTENNQRLSNELTQTQTDLTKVTKAHETLKSESTDFLKLKQQYEAAVQELKETREKAQNAESALNQLIGSEFNKGLLYGGGLLVLGIILGFIFKRPKRRAPLL